MICFLFGAGAEVSYDLCGGEQFAKNVIGLNVDEMNNAITTYYKERVSQINYNNWYPDFNKASLIKYEKLVKAAIRKKLLDEYEHSDEDFKRTTDFKKKYKLTFCNIKNKDKKEREKEEKITINQYTSYMGILDGYFHTLINPRILGPRKFWNVIFCYTRAYLSVVEPLLPQKKYSYLEILNSPVETLKAIENNIDNIDPKNNKSYYGIVKECFNDDKDHKSFSVVTTNYTPLCEKTEVCKKNIAYIHGKIGWFEDPYKWTVYDAEDSNKFEKETKNSLFFPYVFIQSGVKPIVDRMQISEYSKMIQFFHDSSYIVIVGYRINNDDNHINGLIREQIMGGKNVIYFDYDKDSGREKILKRLHIDTNSIDDNSDELNNFEWKDIDDTNWIEKFKSTIESLKEANNG